MITQLDARHKERRLQDPEMQYLMQEIEQYNKLSERKTVSLLETTRREEMAEQDERKARKADVSGLPRITFEDKSDDAPGRLISAEDDEEESDTAHGDDDLDVYLDESARILADFITLREEKPYLVQAIKPVQGPVDKGLGIMNR